MCGKNIILCFPKNKIGLILIKKCRKVFYVGGVVGFIRICDITTI